MSDKSGLLDGKKEIMSFLNNATEHKVMKYLSAGMPVLITGNRWLAHKDNIEDFFKLYTKKRCKAGSIGVNGDAE